MDSGPTILFLALNTKPLIVETLQYFLSSLRGITKKQKWGVKRRRIGQSRSTEKGYGRLRKIRG